jgi:hypothetical protein
MANTKPIGVAYTDQAIVGGTVDATPVGATTASTGAFTQVTVAGPYIGSLTTSVAAGSTNVDAGAAGNNIVLCTTADGTKGLILPVMAVSQEITVINNSASILKIYPFAGAKINALTATTGALSVAANCPVTFICTSATQIFSMPLLPS